MPAVRPPEGARAAGTLWLRHAVIKGQQENQRRDLEDIGALVSALAPTMAARGGSIVSIGSMAGQIGLAGDAAHSAPFRLTPTWSARTRASSAAQQARTRER